MTHHDVKLTMTLIYDTSKKTVVTYTSFYTFSRPQSHRDASKHLTGTGLTYAKKSGQVQPH